MHMHMYIAVFNFYGAFVRVIGVIEQNTCHISFLEDFTCICTLSRSVNSNVGSIEHFLVPKLIFKTKFKTKGISME